MNVPEDLKQIVENVDQRGLGPEASYELYAQLALAALKRDGLEDAELIPAPTTLITNLMFGAKDYLGVDQFEFVAALRAVVDTIEGAHIEDAKNMTRQ